MARMDAECYLCACSALIFHSDDLKIVWVAPITHGIGGKITFYPVVNVCITFVAMKHLNLLSFPFNPA